ncbi:MAG: AraC family transcriptional regulator [Clostridia bacterium]|nr:AraC family transcriptional regulator [Clostridia bacterium]
MLFKSRFDENSPKHIRISSAHLYDELDIIEIGYNRVSPSKRHILNRDVYILHYCISGKGVFQNTPFDNTCLYLTVPRELEIITADERDPYETCWIMFRGTLAPEMLKKCGLPHTCGVFKFDRSKQCAEIIRKAVYDTPGDNPLTEAFCMHAVFQEVMAQHMESVGCTKTRSSGIATDVAEFLSKNYHSDVKIDAVADMFNYSRNHLYSLFKKQYGMSPKEYLLDLRIEKAKLLLSDPDLDISVKETAYALGFRDPFYFSKLFSSRTGLSPAKYRAEKRKKNS